VGPLVAIGSRSVFDKSVVGVRQVASGGGAAHDLIPLVGCEAWGDSIVASKSEGSELVEIEKRQNEAKLLEC